MEEIPMFQENVGSATTVEKKRAISGYGVHHVMVQDTIGDHVTIATERVIIDPIFNELL